MNGCSIVGCPRKRHAKNLCVTHYNRQLFTGSTELRPRPTLRDRSLTCEHCANAFTSKSSRARFCSHRCADASRRGVICMSPERRFIRRLEVTVTCWLWTGALAGGGYGHFVAEHTRSAHRFAYEMFVGPIPAGLELDHLCRVRRCVNPRHLEPVTPAENTRRARLAARGEWNWPVTAS